MAAARAAAGARPVGVAANGSAGVGPGAAAELAADPAQRHRVKVYNATVASGTYSHAPMISYHGWVLLVSWKNHNSSEDSPGQWVRWAWSSDGGARARQRQRINANRSAGVGLLAAPAHLHVRTMQPHGACVRADELA